jgi:multiple sugar transport system substrate-binding protein
MVDRLRRFVRRHRGLFVFGSGAALGVVVTLLVSAFVVPLFDRSDRLEPGDLVILSGRDDGQGNQRQALVEEWNALHPQNQARIEAISPVADAQHSEMVARAQSGHAKVDIYNLDVTWTAEFASAGYIRPLDEANLDASGFLKSPLNTCKYEDKLWALPFNTDAGLLYYRTNLVGKPPTTWPQLVATVQDVLSKPTSGGPIAGYAGQLNDYEGLTVNALEAIWAAGGDVIDGHGRVVIDSPEAQTGLTRLATGLAQTTPQVILRDSTRYDETATTQAFGEGKVLFMRNWPVAHRALDPPAGSDAAQAVPFQVAPLPGASVLGGQNLAIAKDSSHPRAAQKLIEFLTSERSQQILFERGGFAATREIVYRDANVVKLYRYAPTLLSAIQSARTRPITPHYTQFSETFRQIVRQALANGGQLPDDAVSRLEGALQGYKR